MISKILYRIPYKYLKTTIGAQTIWDYKGTIFDKSVYQLLKIAYVSICQILISRDTVDWTDARFI